MAATITLTEQQLIDARLQHVPPPIEIRTRHRISETLRASVLSAMADHERTLEDTDYFALKALGFNNRQHAFNSVNMARRTKSTRYYDAKQAEDYLDITEIELFKRARERALDGK